MSFPTANMPKTDTMPKLHLEPMPSGEDGFRVIYDNTDYGWLEPHEKGGFMAFDNRFHRSRSDLERPFPTVERAVTALIGCQHRDFEPFCFC